MPWPSRPWTCEYMSYAMTLQPIPGYSSQAGARDGPTWEKRVQESTIAATVAAVSMSNVAHCALSTFFCRRLLAIIGAEAGAMALRCLAKGEQLCRGKRGCGLPVLDCAALTSKFLCTPCHAGGVYIAGGIAPRLLERIQHGSLLEGFLMRNGRERFHEILVKTPLYVITNGKVGQIGACAYASRLLKAQ